MALRSTLLALFLKVRVALRTLHSALGLDTYTPLPKLLRCFLDKTKNKSYISNPFW